MSILIFLASFILLLHPVTTIDTFFDIRLGNTIITTHRLPFRETLSWSAQGREVIPYEWLPQVLFAAIHRVGGMNAVAILTAGIGAAMTLIVFSLFRRSTLVTLVFFAQLYEFITPRPQLFAFLFFLFTISLLYHKKRLWLLLPLTWVWANSHASFIIAPILVATAALTDSRRWPYAAGTAAITFLPPLSFKSYEIILQFARNAPMLARFVSEWAPVWTDHVYRVTYSAFLVVMAILGARPSLPWIAIILFSLTAVRHVAIGSIATFATMLHREVRVPRLIAVGIIAGTTILLILKRQSFSDIRPLPSAGATQFLSQYNFGDRMFNDYTMGGYLEYFLPDTKVFFDGRSEVFAQKELPDFYRVREQKLASYDAFRRAMNSFLESYHFSHVIVPAHTGNPLDVTTTTRMADALLDEPAWRLVYFDDTVQVMAATTSGQFSHLTPYRLTPFRGDPGAAREEFSAMIAISDSATAEIGLGTACRALTNLTCAKDAFARALRIDPSSGRAMAGLGALTRDKQLLARAIGIAPYLGEAYLELAELDKANARDILRQGLTAPIDPLSRAKIVQTLQTLQR